jgi:hypothetical protein
LNQEKLEGKYANYFKVGHNEDVFVIDYYQLFPDNDDDETKPKLLNSPNYRIILSPSDANQLLAHLKSAIDEYEQLKNKKAMQRNYRNK